MYLKIKLLEYNIIIYTKILSSTKTRWIINEQPKLNLINKRTMGTLGKQFDQYIKFSKTKNYIEFGYNILEVIDNLDSFEIDPNFVYK
jgi:hypothetical protein